MKYCQLCGLKAELKPAGKYSPPPLKKKVTDTIFLARKVSHKADGVKPRARQHDTKQPKSTWQRCLEAKNFRENRSHPNPLSTHRHTHTDRHSLTHSHTHTHSRTHTYTKHTPHTYTPPHTHTHKHTHTHTGIHTALHTLYTIVQTRARVHAHTHTYTHTDTHTHTNTHTHTHKHTQTGALSATRPLC